jgi:glycosyltransferase involved in cell wall biosynthesis
MKIAFFDYPDVFEDFYPHYGVTQADFGNTWKNTANHAWLKLLQSHVGEVIWYVTCIKPELTASRHIEIGVSLRFVLSSWLHRRIWKTYYLSESSWRWRKYYNLYATIASYLAPLSWPLIRALYRDRPDVIFVQDYCSGRYDVLLLYAWLLKIPLVTFHSGSTPERYHGRLIRPYTLRRADWIFPSGIREKERLALSYGIRDSRMSVIRPPIDSKVYAPGDKLSACRVFGLDPSRRYLLFIGRFDNPVKRITTIMDQFMALSEKYAGVDLVIAGGGRDEHDLRQYADNLKTGRIHFLGWIAGDREKAALFSLADCMVMASTWEASPAVIGEAFACGTPVISSDVGGISDLVRTDVSGWLFRPGDDMALRNCMETVMSEPDRMHAMRPSVREIALRMVSNEVVSRTLKDAFDSVVDNAK